MSHDALKSQNGFNGKENSGIYWAFSKDLPLLSLAHPCQYRKVLVSLLLYKIGMCVFVFPSG